MTDFGHFIYWLLYCNKTMIAASYHPGVVREHAYRLSGGQRLGLPQSPALWLHNNSSRQCGHRLRRWHASEDVGAPLLLEDDRRGESHPTPSHAPMSPTDIAQCCLFGLTSMSLTLERAHALLDAPLRRAGLKWGEWQLGAAGATSLGGCGRGGRGCGAPQPRGLRSRLC